MRGFMAWGVLIAVFLFAGEGLNLFRIHIEQWLAYGHPSDIVVMVVGLVMAFVGTAFLGGYVYYRDKKRGKLQREGWLGRPIPKEVRKAARRAAAERLAQENSSTQDS